MKEVELPNNVKFRYYTPKELKEHLDKFIIGQDEAKKVLSVAVYNHYKRILLSHVNPDAMVESITQAGYVGDDVESIIVGLMRKCGWSISQAQYGIISIDEIDKLAKRGSNPHISRDVVGEGVQQALLKMVEGDLVGIPPQEGRKHPDQQLIYVNTKNILFIGTGAFSGIEDTIKSRINANRIGYANSSKNGVDTNSDDFNPFDYLSQDDLKKYGMIPEFIGRFPVITTVNSLTKEDLTRILTEPSNSLINQYKMMMAIDGIELTVSKDALEYIADIALKIGTGARGLRSMMESVLNDFVYEYSDLYDYPEQDESGKVKMVPIEITKADVEKTISKRYSNYMEEQ